MTDIQDRSQELKDLLCFNFYLGWRAVQAYYKPSFTEGITSQRIYVLALCDRNEGRKVSEIAEALEIDLPAISSLVDRMVIDELLERKRSIKDRRVVEIFLTQKGEEIRDDNEHRLFEADEPLFSDYIQKSDLEVLRRIVKGLTEASREVS